ncbi:MAG TPA: hypothetical protein VGM10_35815 [Actinocrinis sp.]
MIEQFGFGVAAAAPDAAQLAVFVGVALVGAAFVGAAVVAAALLDAVVAAAEVDVAAAGVLALVLAALEDAAAAAVLPAALALVESLAVVTVSAWAATLPLAPAADVVVPVLAALDEAGVETLEFVHAPASGEELSGAANAKPAAAIPATGSTISMMPTLRRRQPRRSRRAS